MRKIRHIVAISLTIFVIHFCSAAYALDLPPEAQRDLYVVELADHLKAEQWNKAYPIFKKLELLSKKHKIELPDSVVYYRGEVAVNLKKYDEAQQYLGDYIRAAGSNGKFYGQALKLISKTNAETQAKAEEFYQKGMKHNWSSWIKAEPWWLKAAKLGHPGAQERLGFIYKGGTSDGVSKDKKAAVMWYEKSVEQSYPPGMNGLAYLYRKGVGVNKDTNKALELYKQSVELGNAEAITKIAEIYEKGWGVPVNYKAAISWYVKAANLGNENVSNLSEASIAKNKLGDLYSTVQETFNEELKKLKDDKKAINWYRKSAGEYCLDYTREQGGCGYNHEGRLKLAMMYRKGLGAKKNSAQAMKLYKTMNGDREAQFMLGQMFHDGEGTKVDYSEAKKMLEIAAKKTKYQQKSKNKFNTYAQYYLASMFEEGKGVTQNFSEAADYYKKVASSKDNYGLMNYYNKMANYKLGLFSESGKGVSRDYSVAKKYYHEAKQLRVAQLRMAGLAAEGLGGDKNISLAMEKYKNIVKAKVAWGYSDPDGMKKFNSGNEEQKETAKTKLLALVEEYATSEDSAVQAQLGDLYYYGYAVNKNIDKGIKLYLAAAKKNEAEAMRRLGDIYYDKADEKSKNYSEVESLYLKYAEAINSSTEKGNPRIYYRLGGMYAMGVNGVAKDSAKAERWYQKAADLGYAAAQYALAGLYEKGAKGVAKNKELAIKWYQKVADSRFSTSKPGKYPSGRMKENSKKRLSKLK